MDMQISNITIIDENEEALKVQLIPKIIAAALFEQVQLHNSNIHNKSHQQELSHNHPYLSIDM